MTQNRKRGRNYKEEEMEFMPLSKRINNLHINNSLLQQHSVQQQQSVQQSEWPQGGPSNIIPETPPDSVHSLEWNNSNYSPELTETQNPYYYNINKLLFQMYLERQQRSDTN